MADATRIILSILYALFATAGLGLSTFANYFCQLLSFQPRDNVVLPAYHFGIFRYTQLSSVGLDFTELQLTTESTCVEYPDDMDFFNQADNIVNDNDGEGVVDTYWMISGSFAIIATALGFIGCCCLWLNICCDKLCGNFCCWGLLCFLFSTILPLSQGMTFFMLRSNICTENPILNFMSRVNLYEEDCQLDLGSYFSMGAIGIWFLTGAIMGICG